MQVIKSGKIDSLYVFGKWTQDGQTQTELKYLGQIISDSGKIYKVLNSCWIWGLSQRATNRILIYDYENKYIGNYYLITKSDLPDKIENGKLIFKNSDKEDCDKSIITKIDFKHGLPKKIFINCKGNDGDIFVYIGWIKKNKKYAGHNTRS